MSDEKHIRKTRSCAPRREQQTLVFFHMVEVTNWVLQFLRNETKNIFSFVEHIFFAPDGRSYC